MDNSAIFNEHRSLLIAIAYRMVGTVMDVEDVVQEAYLRWKDVDAQHIESPGAYLRTIVTRLAIDHLRKARKSRELYDGLWLPEPWVDSTPPHTDSSEMADSLSTAFMIVLETLAPAERAAFLLREIFGYSYDEIAEAINKSSANCRQLVKRAKDKVRAAKPARTADQREVERLVNAFIVASASPTMDSFATILAEDAVFHTDHGGKAAANKRPIFGADKIARFIHGILSRFTSTDHEVIVAEINGSPGLIAYEDGEPSSAMTFSIVDGKIQDIYSVRNPEKLVRLKKS